MYCVYSFENMATTSDRCEYSKVRGNGSVSFSIFQALIFILARQD